NDPSFSPDDQKAMLTELYQSIRNLDAFLKSLKNEEQSGMEQSHLEISKFSLSSLLVTISNRMEPKAKKKNITLTCEIYKEYWLEADQEYMSQIIDLLLVNAISVAMPG